MKKTFKKAVGAMLAACMMSAVFTGCGSKQAPTAAETKKEVQAETQAETQKDAESAAPAAAAESDWPTNTVQFLLPASAGGATDLSGRSIANFLQEKFGKSMVIVNQTDGNGVVAFENTRNAKPDGLTLLYYHSGILVSEATGLYDKDVLNDFKVISVLPAGGSYALVVSPSSEYNSVDDLIEAAKAAPGTITCGVQMGSSTHVMSGMLQKDSGAEFKYVEGGSDQDKLAAMQGGHMTFAFINTKNAKPYSEAGKLKVLATIAGTPDRDPAMPDTPSLYELGYESCIFGTDFFILGPKDLDDATAEKINAAIGEATKDASVIDVHEKINMPLTWLSVEESIERVKERQTSIDEVTKAIGIAK